MMAPSLSPPVASSLIQREAFSLISAISGKRVSRAGKVQKGGFLSLLALARMMKVLGKGVTRTGRDIII